MLSVLVQDAEARAGKRLKWLGGLFSSHMQQSASPSCSYSSRTLHRYHIALSRYQRRLALETQANLDAIGSFSSGTAFLVQRDPKTGTGLVLTNEHVHSWAKAYRENKHVYFQPGGADKPECRARVTRVVAVSKTADFALLQVKLPEALRRLQPIRLSAAAIGDSRAVYSGGYSSSLYQLSPHKLSPMARKNIVADWNGDNRGTLEVPKMIMVGQVLDSGRSSRATINNLDGTSSVVECYQTRMPSYHGLSGSPVIDAKSHRAVGLHFAGNRSKANFISTRQIFAELSQKTPSVPADLKTQVQRLMSDAGWE